VVTDYNVRLRECLRPRFYVFYGLCEFIGSAHAVGVGLVIARIVVVYYITNENDLITKVTFIGIYAELQITVQLERAMQVTNYKNSPLFTLQVLKCFELARGEARARHLVHPNTVLRFVNV